MQRSALVKLRAGICLAIMLLAWPVGTVLAVPDSPEDVVRAHFASISAEDYTGADDYFSGAFIRAFKADVQKLNYYYLARQAQLTFGYEVTEVAPLNDPGRETMVVVVEFGPFNPDSVVTATERMHYYLIREKVEAGEPLRDAEGMAWRIDIVDALRFDSLADARRRPYLYTRESWDDDPTRELRSRQGLYRIYLALEAFREDNGQYPFRLLGGENRRDELIAGDYLPERYPDCGFANRPMDNFGADRNHAGDFGYYSVDSDGDGLREGFWLFLHGKDQAGFYYTDRDIVYIVNQDYAPDQRELAEQFAEYWRDSSGQSLVLRDIAWEQGLAQKTASVAGAAADALERLDDAPLMEEPLRPAFPGIIAPREQPEAPEVPVDPALDTAGAETGTEPVEELAEKLVDREEPDKLTAIRATVQVSNLANELATKISALAAQLRPVATEKASLPDPPQELEVHSYGL